MGVEEILPPVPAVLGVSCFCVDAHPGGEDLGGEEDEEAWEEFGGGVGIAEGIEGE